MNKPKAAFVVCASHKDGICDPLGRPYVNRELINKAIEKLRETGMNILEETLVVATKKEAKTVFKILKNDESVQTVIVFPGTWNWAANLVGSLREFYLANKKILLWIHSGPQGWRTGSGLLIHGALKEAGIEHKLVYGSYDDKATISRIYSFVKAVQLKHTLNNSTFCLLGGRGQGQTCGVSDPSQWMKMFGIDIDSMSYSNVIEMANSVTDEEIQGLEKRLMELFGYLPDKNGGNIKSLKLYIAMKKFAEENNYLGIAIQNLPGIGDEYVIPSFAQSMLIEDKVGNSALGDMNVTLTTWLMAHASNESVFYGDVQDINLEKGELKIVSDGSGAPSLATSKYPVKYAARGIGHEGNGDGITVSLICKQGVGVIGKLLRNDGEMQMCLRKCEVFLPNTNEIEDKLNECGIPFWPHAFTKVEGDLETFIEDFSGEYICLGYGEELYDILVEFCEITGIKVLS